MQDSITPRAQRESIFQEHCHDMMKPVRQSILCPSCICSNDSYMQREWGYATLTREFDKRFWSLQPSLLVPSPLRGLSNMWCTGWTGNAE